ncbi:MAG: hypothetical protein PHS42_07250 [Sulfurimonas sp.]|nr:hypothetical protein [Sulfurimonas sp.]MDD3835255.1 hypothetical protein [Sulfurimonas sp.]
MHPVIDTIMVILFVIFMIFVFGGYHKNKSAQREAEFKRQEKNSKKDIKESKK